MSNDCEGTSPTRDLKGQLFSGCCEFPAREVLKKLNNNEDLSVPHQMNAVRMQVYRSKFLSLSVSLFYTHMQALIITAVISLVPYLTDKCESTVLSQGLEK